MHSTPLSRKPPFTRTHPVASEGEPPAKPPVKVELKLENGILRASFEAHHDAFHVNPKLDVDVPQWELWNWDVVELFFGQKPAEGQPVTPYFEYQVSPLRQFFALKIFEPRIKHTQEFNWGYEHHAEILGEGRWKAEMAIRLAALGLPEDGSQLVGNAYAIFGAPPERTFWSLFLPEMEKPDFHRPEYFKPLF